MKKKPFNRVRYASYKKISEKACVVHCYDGSESILPLSQIIHEDDSLLVPAWLINKKWEEGYRLQHSSKLIWK